MGNLYSSQPHFLQRGDNVRFTGCLEDSHCTRAYFCVQTRIHATGRFRCQQLITTLTMCRLSSGPSLTSLILRGSERGTHLPKATQLDTKLEEVR